MQTHTMDSHNTVHKQPAVIPIFFATEMWERFGFYMIQSLLVLYMTSELFGFSDVKSYSILAAFSAISYITPILGGYFANKILDFEHAITLGGFLLAIGYAVLSLPHQEFFFVALAIISVGNGFFKPNISAYLGDFYRVNDLFREKGYTIFYVGINIGVLLSSATSGYLVRYFGWHTPFLTASLGLLIGTVTFVFGLYYLKSTKRFNRIKPSAASKNPLLIAAVYVSVLVLMAFSYEFILYRSFSNQLVLWGGTAIFIGLFAHAFRYDTKVRNRLLAAIILTLISIVFWAIFFQLFFSMNLFIDRAVNRQFFSLTLPTPLFISLESIFIVLLGPFFASLWQKLAVKNKNPSTPMKFTLAMFSVTVAFLIAYASTKWLGVDGMNHKMFIVVAYLFITIGELLLSPIGLMMITVLVPQELVGSMMGVWFVALGLGEKLAGAIANFAAIPKQIHTISAMNQIYGDAFLRFSGLALVAGVVCLCMVPVLKRMMDVPNHDRCEPRA